MAGDVILTKNPVILSALVERMGRSTNKTGMQYVRASAVHTWCPRAECLAHRYGYENPIDVAVAYDPEHRHPVHLLQTFELGTAVHTHVQHHLLADVLYGWWRCGGCGKVFSGDRERLHGAIKMPKGVPCPSCGVNARQWQYEELSVFDDDLGISGHIDGVIRLQSGKFAAFELKTIGKSGFDSLKSPKSEHVMQDSLYAHCLGVEYIVIVYWSKGWHPSDSTIRRVGKAWGTGGLKEFVVRRDDDFIEEVLSKRAHVRQFVEGGCSGPLPEMHRSCTSFGCDRAISCLVSEECRSEFSREGRGSGS